jgi:nucleoside-diphosphate-sugar epimerase
MIVVLGGTGLVGAHLIYELTVNGNMVKAMYRSKESIDNAYRIFSFYYDDVEKLSRHIEWVQGDIENLTVLEEILEGASTVYHCAAQVSFGSSGKRRMLENNINGTANVVNACLNKGIKRLCYMSSVAAIGHAGNDELIDEDMIWTPSKDRSTYSVSKFHAEMEVWRGIEEGLSAVIVNPSIIVGPGIWGKSSTAMFDAVYKGMKFYTPGSSGFVDVRDVVNIMIMLANSDIKGERYILNAENLSYKDFFSLEAQSLDKKPPSIEVSRWMAEFGWRAIWILSKITGRTPQITRETVDSGFSSHAYSNKKITEALRFKFTTIAHAVKDTAEIYLEEKGLES